MPLNVILPLHLLTLVYVAWNVINADHMGFSWMRGKVEMLDEKKVRKYHIGTWIGLCLMITTGLLMFWPLREYLLTLRQFYVKMGFVLALVINGFVIGKISPISTMRTFASLSTKEKLPLLISGAVSTLSWLGAAAGGFYLFS